MDEVKRRYPKVTPLEIEDLIEDIECLLYGDTWDTLNDLQQYGVMCALISARTLLETAGIKRKVKEE